jgi:hypothetical protein
MSNVGRQSIVPCPKGVERYRIQHNYGTAGHIQKIRQSAYIQKIKIGDPFSHNTMTNDTRGIDL